MKNAVIRRVCAAAAVFAMTVAGLTIVGTPAQALSGSDFQAGNIISDQVFFNAAAMSQANIQSFLQARESGCTASNGFPCLKDYSQATSSRAASAGHCAAYAGASSESASQIIYKVSQACGINAQVLLVLIEKEQGLVTSTAPTAYKYQAATGYGCPDTSGCDSQYYGFYNQVYKAAWQFREYTSNPGDWRYRIGNTAILYSPNTACGSSTVNIQNQATANLYNYTPYQPNAAALANLGGIGDSCSSYGNRNFWVYFNNWFGSSTAPVDPMAYLDSSQITIGPDKAFIQLSGWAMDRADRTKSIEVDVYVDQPNGKTVGYALKADQSRPDVGNAYPGAGALHGYSTSIPVTQSGNYHVCIFPMTTGGGWLLTCRDFAAPAASPTGSVDTVQVQQANGSASILVSGWAFDRNLNSISTEVDLYVARPNGSVSGIALTANRDRPDIARVFPGAGSLHGYATTIPIAAVGNYQVCAYAMGNPLFGTVAQSLGCYWLQAMASSPLGSLDSVTVSSTPDGASAISASGWSFDTAVPGAQIPVDIYVDRPDGTTAGTRIVAGASRPDVGRVYPAAGAMHGYSSAIPISTPGTYHVCAFGIGQSIFGASNSLLGCRNVSARSDPTFGALDSVTVTGTGPDRVVVASGWAADPGAPSTSIPVDVYFDRPTGATAGVEVTANLSRPDIARIYPTYGGAHGYVASTPAPEAGTYNACAFAIAVNKFGSNTLLGCKVVTVAG